MQSRDLARYPFVREVSAYVKEKGVSLEDLISHPAFAGARTRGKKRVTDAIASAKIEEVGLRTEDEFLQEMLSYAMARILVSCVADGFLIRRYALAESKTMFERLQRESVDLMMEIASELSVDAQLQDGVPNLHFAEFLRLTSGIRSKEWKLVNTEVKQGRVSLPNAKFARVLEAALFDKIEDELPLPVSQELLDRLKPEVRELSAAAEQMKDRYQAEGFGEVDVECFPPCMKRMLAMVQSGANLSHPGRFALTSFLFNIGVPREEILKTFGTSPDFDLSKTKYQIDHITGEISGTTYTPPNCHTMKTLSVCFFPDNLCSAEWVKHPLIYYRAKCRRKRKAAAAAAEKKETKQEPETGKAAQVT
ncbi:MAG TPA: DNA primase large subunit PriL [Methanomassiliicoccales archaeon]|nr:DNA primase large subunit PriL [Methanomassiliicoccales archaeon]